MTEKDQDDADKRIDQLARRTRLLRGASSSLATTIIVSAIYEHIFKRQMDPNLAVACSTLIGSMVTGFVLCWNDFRALLVLFLIKKRLIPNRRT